MAHALTVRAAAGVVRWGYHQAATLERIEVSRNDDGSWQLHAAIVTADTFRLSQTPLEVHVTRQSGSWRWPIVELIRVADGTLTARLGLRKGTTADGELRPA